MTEKNLSRITVLLKERKNSTMYAKKNRGRRVIALLVALMLVIGGVIGGTLAWLMTKTDPLENTFVAGDINIQMVEHKLDLQTGAHDSSNTYVTAQEDAIELLPGRTVYKDPTVIVEKGSEPCYVRVFMIVDYAEGMDNAYEGVEVISQWFNFDTANWTTKQVWQDYEANDYGHVFEFRYNGAVTAESKDQCLTLFDAITIPSDLDKNEDNEDMYYCLQEAKLMFVAQAVQAAGFESMDAAFTEVGRPDVQLNMTNKTMTLEELINRNIGHQQTQ